MNDERRRELEEILDNYASELREAIKNLDFRPTGKGLFSKILAWADRWQRRPEREEIDAKLREHGIINYDVPGGNPASSSLNSKWCFRIVDDLLALLSEPRKPVWWCNHWLKIGPNWRCQIPSIDGNQMFAMEDVKFCCWCGAERPKEGA